MVVAAVVVRGTFVLQIAASMLPNGPAALHRSLFYGLTSFVIIESAALAAYMLYRGTYVPWAAIIDGAIMLVLVIFEPFSVRNEDVVGTWVAWGYAGAIACAVPAAIGVRLWRIVLGLATALGIAYLVGCLIHPISHNAQVTAMTNAVSVVGMSIACRLGGGFVREMGQEADRARELERTLIHNYAPVLHLLSSDIPDPTLKESAMGAAARGAQQFRAVLSDATRLPDHDRRGRRYLQNVIDGVCQEFSDLHLVRNLELLGETAVDGAQADALAEGVRTLLWNVRRHAHATRVTVHGDADDHGQWAVTITDNGVGFDPEATAPGWGLRVQAGSALERVGLNVAVDSSPGDGTRARIAPVPVEGSGDTGVRNAPGRRSRRDG